MTLKLGVIGLSDGNGHPYSWSAICNGYDPIEMEKCGFPVIPRYLDNQRFPEDCIQMVKVSHVWAQDSAVAQHIARAALIPNVVNRFTDLIGEVDGVLLARDDGENHLAFAMPFLTAGLPVYVDKPLALSRQDAASMFAAQHYSGQLFSCSALRYAREFMLSEDDRCSIGSIRAIHAFTPKNWDKYSVHVIEPALNLIPERGSIRSSSVWTNGSAHTLSVVYSNDTQLHIHSAGDVASPLTLRVIGTVGWKDLYFRDAFSSFKSALGAFIQTIQLKRPVIPEAFTLEVVDLIEAGRSAK